MSEFLPLLRKCYPVHPVPSEILINREMPDCDSEEAALLFGIAWTDVDDKFWFDNHCAAYALLPSAFVYYLPSMLVVSIEDRCDLIRGVLIDIFNTSGHSIIFTEFLLEISELFSIKQAGCLFKWFEILVERSYLENDEERERVLFTLMLLDEVAQEM